MMSTRKVGQISFNTVRVGVQTSMKGSMLFAGTLDNGRRKVAVKKVVDSITNYEEVNKLIQLSKVKQHDNIIRYYLVEHEEPYYYIALEWCHGTLTDFVEDTDFDRRGLTDIEAARQIASGLNHIHSCGIFHLDLKPSNVLITRANDSSNRVVITDFDVSKCSEGGKSLRTFTFSGSEGWVAPEVSVINYEYRLSSKVDMFAMGCLFYYIITKGFHPFHDKAEVDYHQCQKNICLYSEKDYDLKLRNLDKTTQTGLLAEDLIFQLLQRNPKQRPGASICLEHPVFWDSLKEGKFLETAGDTLYNETDNHLHHRLDQDRQIVIGSEWDVGEQIRVFVSKGKYDREYLSDLLRFIRDHCVHLWKHRSEAPGLENRKDGKYDILEDVNKRYPGFLLHVYYAVVPWRHEEKFKEFYPDDDSHIKIWDNSKSTQLVDDVTCVMESVSNLQISNTEGTREFRGIAIDNQGNLVITDSGLHWVCVLDDAGCLKPCLDSSLFDSPHDVAVDKEGNIAVADTGKNAVFIFDKEGKLTQTIADVEGKALREPNGVTFSASGKLVICDTHNHRIIVFSECKLELVFGKKGRGQRQLFFPWMAAADDNDLLYISDAGNHRLQVFTVQGRFYRTIGCKGGGELQFIEPTGIVLFQDCLLVTDHRNKRVQVISKTGKYVESFGPDLGQDTEDFSHVWGVAYKEDGDFMTFFVVDYGSKSRIVKLKLRVNRTTRKAAIPQEHDG